MEAQYLSQLLFCNSHWLSKGNAVARVYNLREEVALFIEEESLAYAEHFQNEQFIPKLAYLNYVFEKFQHIEHKYARECY
jgi:hypothetical protein